MKKSAVGFVLGMMHVFLFIAWVIIGAFVLFDGGQPSQVEYFCVLIVLLVYIAKDAFSYFYFN